MNIIESEIAKREELITKHANKLLEADNLEAQATELLGNASTIRNDMAEIDPDSLANEIAELRTYIAETESAEFDNVAVDGTGVPI